MIINRDLTPLQSDTLFKDSPDTGAKSCICSRCAARIQEHETAIRIWTTNEEGEVNENSQEYRYCEFCTTGKKFFNCKHDMEHGSYKCTNQCAACKERFPTED